MKTILLNAMFAGTYGEKNIDGEIINGITEKMGYMLQRDCLLEWRTVLSNILFGLEIKGRIKKEFKEYAEELLKKYGLYDFKYHYPKEISGGMKQRVALIRTLVLDPDILLLDEPFSSLDYQSKIIVQEDIYRIIKESKKTTILVTHDITEAIAMADIVYVLTSRPSTIKKRFEIDLEINENEKTPLSARKSPNFQKYFSLIWKELEFKE